MVKVRWTTKSIKQFEQIFDYIAGDSVTYAARFVSSLVKSGDSLNKMPLRGRVVPEFRDNTIREILYQNYRIVYRTNSIEDIEILTVIHSARDFEDAFEEE